MGLNLRKLQRGDTTGGRIAPPLTQCAAGARRRAGHVHARLPEGGEERVVGWDGDGKALGHASRGGGAAVDHIVGICVGKRKVYELSQQAVTGCLFVDNSVCKQKVTAGLCVWN